MKIVQPLILSSLMLAGSLQAAVVLTITDVTPLTGVPNTTGIPNSFTGTTTPGTVASNLGNPTNTYTWTGADLTSLGATETGGAGTGTITFTVGFTQTGGSGIFNVSGKVSVTGGAADNRINDTETLTSTIALTGISGYTGIDLSDLSIGFTYAELNNVAGTLDITGAFGSIATTTNATFAPSSSFTIDPRSGAAATLNTYTIQLTAIPEPTAALLGSLGLLAILRRRRS
jgi:hypothetical protein